VAKLKRRLPKLNDCWLYAVSSKKDLARRLSTERFVLTGADLEALTDDADNYKLFTTRNGRDVQEPKRLLQRVHMRIHKLLSRIETPDYLHSAIKGRSYLTNARSHVSNVPVIKIDVKKFFRSVPRFEIFNFFLDDLKCRKDVAGLLADILTFNRHLPTGSSASPILSYYAFKSMFDGLYDLTQKLSLEMTCYVDDITFSGERANRAALVEARKLVAASGLKSHKLRRFSASQPKVITGVCNASVGECVPNKLHLKIADGFKALASAKSSDEKLRVLRPLLGRMEAAAQIDPAFGGRAKTLRFQMRGILRPAMLQQVR
jgi:RNA-directed DNA polymerase